MIVVKERCIGCGQCIPYCPVGAITLENKKARINLDMCTECFACARSGACKVNALEQQELKGARVVRSLLSDVFTEYEGIAGRGTEEMKTNDITGRFKRGFAGIAVELGRPGSGATFRDVQTVARAVARHGVLFEKKNPVTGYLDPATGNVREDILDEKVISAIIEILVKNEELEKVLRSIIACADKVDCVFSLDVATAVEPDNTIPAKEIVEKMGLFIRPNCKTNVGLGRPKAEIS